MEFRNITKKLGHVAKTSNFATALTQFTVKFIDPSITTPSYTFATDASGRKGYAYIGNNTSFAQSWTPDNHTWSIYIKEIFAIFTLLSHLADSCNNSRVLIWCDNQAAV